MGNGAVKYSQIKKNELMELSKITMFNSDLIFTFHSFYKKFCCLKRDDGVIDYQEFLMCLNSPSNVFTEHLFYAIDQNCNDTINFREFLKFFANIQNGNTISQTKLTFKLFSNAKTKKIDKKTVIDILSDSIKNNETLKSFITIKDIKFIVDDTFSKHSDIMTSVNNHTISHLLHRHTTDTIEPLRNVKSNNFKNNTCSNYTMTNQNLSMHEDLEDGISYDVFSEIFSLNPHITEWMSINVDKLKSFNKSDNRACCF